MRSLSIGTLVSAVCLLGARRLRSASCHAALHSIEVMRTGTLKVTDFFLDGFDAVCSTSLLLSGVGTG